jgi:hypothetical protein
LNSEFYIFALFLNINEHDTYTNTRYTYSFSLSLTAHGKRESVSSKWYKWKIITMIWSVGIIRK